MSESSKVKTATAVTALCALVTVGTEYAGALELRIGSFALVLLPLFFAFVITVALNLSLSWRRPEAAAPIWSCAGQLLQLLTVVFVVRAGVVLGTALPTIVEAGPAILLRARGHRLDDSAVQFHGAGDGLRGRQRGHDDLLRGFARARFPRPLPGRHRRTGDGQ
ncbi:DUF3100 domain-containing protein [Amycolatopsis japonica]|uniref:DUF3100 domain-containing protein n=1 Tax=Amycolatopsis japonica TaxID=208439 RepID=UPI0037880B86